MALLYPEEPDYFPEMRKRGFPRYKEVFEGSWKEFFFAGFLTLIYCIPFGAGLVYAILSHSILVALAAGIIGGAIAGPGIACLYDLVLRRLRDDKSDWWVCWKRATKNNFKASILPGLVEFTYFSLAVFSLVLMLSGVTEPSFGTMALLLLGAFFVVMLYSVLWPQLVLFEQKFLLRLKNTFFFVLFHLGKVFWSALLKIVWWLLIIFLVPWSAFVVPIFGIWYILFLTVFLLYVPMDEDFKIEEQFHAAFPEQFGDKTQEKKEEYIKISRLPDLSEENLPETHNEDEKSVDHEEGGE